MGSHVFFFFFKQQKEGAPQSTAQASIQRCWCYILFFIAYLTWGNKYLMCESLCQQWQRISNKVELIWSNALAAVGCNGQCIPLSIDAKEL